MCMYKCLSMCVSMEYARKLCGFFSKKNVLFFIYLFLKWYALCSTTHYPRQNHFISTYLLTIAIEGYKESLFSVLIAQLHVHIESTNVIIQGPGIRSVN